MAYTTINKSTDYFNTKLYSGNGTTNHNITGVGFQPDLVWTKGRSGSYGVSNHKLADAVRGAGNIIHANLSDAQYDQSGTTGATIGFISDGFTLGTNSNSNNSSTEYVSWNWKAGTTGSGNTGGSGTYKAYSYSVNTTAGFSIVKYVGNGTGGHTIPHHLGVAPSNVIIKDISASNSWICKMKGYSGYLYLNNTDAGTSNSTWLPTDANNLTLANTWGAYNTNNATYIAYCFAEKTGYSKFGSYTGNGSTDGTFIYTGFKPTFIMIKRWSGGSNNWLILDNKRDPINQMGNGLFPNLTGGVGTGYNCDFLSNGFKWRLSGSGENGTDFGYIYMAFGQSLVGSNNVPCTAR